MLLSILAGSPEAHAQKRVALVIGNSAYEHTSKLDNPKNDAIDVAAALKSVGFQVVEGFDLDKTAFERKVRDFSAALRNAEVGLFFFAGHGLQVAGHNYLVPIDAKAETADALDWEMVRLDLVHRTMERAAATNIIFLDACRNNPLSRNLARAMGTRSTEIGRGLASVESGVGTLISFSTQPGNVALDGTGRNSPFAGSLVKRIASSTDDLSAVLIDVRNDVRKETNNAQVPWEHSALTGRFYFNQPKAGGSTPAAPTRLSEAAEAWSAAERSTNIPALEAFVARYKDTFYADLARARIDELAKKQVATAVPPKAPAKGTEPTACVDVTVGNGRECLRPGQSFKDCPDCPEMIVIPAGEFMMGSPDGEFGRDSDEGPQRRVAFSRPFAVAKFAATFSDWDACAGKGGCNGYRPSDKDWGRGNRPVVNVSWDDAKAYVKWLTAATGKSYRVLSEAEREYVTRAGTTTPFWWGPSVVSEVNFNSVGQGRPSPARRTLPVDSFKPNPWGLFQVHGNVSEWVEDCWNNSYRGAPSDGSAWISGDCGRRVLRGGSWSDPEHRLRAADRDTQVVSFRGTALGFRIARTLAP